MAAIVVASSLSSLFHPVMNLKVLITSVPNKPSLYSNIFKHRLARDSPLIQ